jgi:hypothetical protein
VPSYDKNFTHTPLAHALLLWVKLFGIHLNSNLKKDLCRPLIDAFGGPPLETVMGSLKYQFSNAKHIYIHSSKYFRAIWGHAMNA